MAFNKHIVPRRPRDPGAAQQSMDLSRRTQKLEATYGVIGAGATITAPTIETDEPGVSRMYMQGSLNGAVPGLYLVDASDHSIFSITNAGVYLWKGDGTLSHYLSLTSANGLSLVESNSTAFGLNWEGGFHIRAYSSGYVDISAPYAQLCMFNIKANTSDGFPVHIQAYANGHTATLLNGTGNATFPGDVAATTFTPSDESLKEDFEFSIGGRHKLLHDLKPVKFKFKNREGLHYGFVGQHVREVLPEITRDMIMPAPQLNQEPLGPDDVPETPDHKAIIAVSSDSLVALLVATVQEQEHRIKQLEDRDGNN